MCRRTVRGFTLFELLVTIGVIGVVAALVVPTMTDDRLPRLVATAWILQSDIEFAQTMTIAHPDRAVVLRLADDGRGWWLAPDSDRDAPIADDRGDPYVVAFGEGRALVARDLEIRGFDLEGGRDLVFTELGGLEDFTLEPALVLVGGGRSIALLVSPSTGVVTLVDDQAKVAAIVAGTEPAPAEMVAMQMAR